MSSLPPLESRCEVTMGNDVDVIQLQHPDQSLMYTAGCAGVALAAWQINSTYLNVQHRIVNGNQAEPPL